MQRPSLKFVFLETALLTQMESPSNFLDTPETTRLPKHGTPGVPKNGTRPPVTKSSPPPLLHAQQRNSFATYLRFQPICANAAAFAWHLGTNAGGDRSAARRCVASRVHPPCVRFRRRECKGYRLALPRKGQIAESAKLTHRFPIPATLGVLPPTYQSHATTAKPASRNPVPRLPKRVPKIGTPGVPKNGNAWRAAYSNP